VTKQELASELYELIVVRIRWGGERRDSIVGNSYDTLPDWMKEMWDLKAEEFAVMNGIEIKEN
jgi:hypothetical protein